MQLRRAVSYLFGELGVEAGYFFEDDLGHRLIMAQPEVNGSQLEHGKEVCGVFFVARGEPTEVFDAVEEALDAVARAIEHRAEAGFPATMHHRRDVGRGTGGFDLAAQPIGVIGLIGEHDGVLAQMAEQLRGDRAIASLAGRQDQFERQSARIGQGVDLGRAAAARAPDRFDEGPPYGWPAPPAELGGGDSVTGRDSSMDIAVLGIDLGKNSCSLVGLDGSGKVILRRRIQRMSGPH